MNIEQLSPQQQRELLAKLLVEKAQQPDTAPLSLIQEQIWTWEQLVPHSPLYNFAQASSIDGALDVGAFERSITDIICRHEILRTSFQVIDREPRQIIQPPAEFKVDIIDFEPTPQRTLPDFLTEEACRPFNLSQGPLFKIMLIRLPDAGSGYILFRNFHHIICDGWSAQIFNEEFEALYAAHCSGQPANLPDLPMQYQDFARWQQQQLPGELARQQHYWQQQLANLSLVQLPADRPRTATLPLPGAKVAFALPLDILTRLETLSRQQGVTLFVTLLSALKCLLARITGQEDIAVGTFIANRKHPHTAPLIGLFINHVLLRSPIRQDQPFTTLLKDVHTTTVAAQANQDISVERVETLSAMRRDLGQVGLAPVRFVFQNFKAMPSNQDLFRWDFIETGLVQNDFSLYCFKTETGLEGYIEYNTDVFEAATIKRIAGHYLTLLEGVATNPGQRVADLQLLSAAEQHQILHVWNDTRRQYDVNLCLHQLFEKQAAQTPEAAALIFEQSNLSYQALNQRANQVAHYLISLGVGLETMVGLYLGNSLELIIGLLAVLKAGGAYVPLDPAYPRQRLAYMLADTHLPVVLTQQALAQSLPEHAAQVVCLDGDQHLIDQYPNTNPQIAMMQDNLAYVLYTSGSTGRPKGVLGLHRTPVNRILHEPYDIGPDAVFAKKTSLNFIDAIWEIFAPLSRGLPLVMIPEADLTDPEALLRHFDAHKVTHLVLVPSLLRMLLDNKLCVANHLSNLRFWSIGGEPLHAELAVRLETALPQATIANFYGTSEFWDAAWHTFQVDTDRQTVPVGQVFSNVQAVILDRNQQLVPVGVAGELYIGGDGLSRGYLNQPALTAATFIPNPFSHLAGERLYKTGDMAQYRPNGDIEVLGRVDYQVKIRGFRVELEEIEAHLNRHPAVKTAVVVVREEPQGQQKLVAYIVSQAGTTVIGFELQKYLAGKLPKYMVPALYIPLDTLPFTPSGKIDRRALPLPAAAAQEQESSYLPPVTPTETALAAIWAELLGMPQPGVEHSFFALGGHSLLAIQLITRVRELFGIDIALQGLSDTATIRAMAANIDRALSQPHASNTVTLPANMMLLKAGSTSHSLFLVPPVAGVAFPYVELAGQVKGGWSIYGLQSIGLLDGETALTDMGTIAQHHVQALRQVQPHGPYYLAGWSFGGVVALEMARQLQQAGETVAWLAAIDTPLTLWLQPSFLRRSKFFATAVLPFLWPYVSEFLSLQAVSLGISALKSPEVRRLLRVLRANVRASSSYHPRPYQGRITLFQTGRNVPDEAWGWGDIATGEIERHWVAGNHMNLLRAPHVAALAEALAACLTGLKTGTDDGRP